MSFLDKLWGQDYSQILETGLADPKSGEPLFVAVHAEGRGADVLTQSDLPEVSDVGDYAAFAASAKANVGNAMQDIAGDILAMSSQMAGQSPAVNALMHSGQVNVFGAPDVADIPVFDEVLETMSKEAAILSNQAARDDPELSAVMGEIANDAWELREDIQRVLDSTGFSVVNAATAQLTELGISPAEINAAMRVDPVVNTHQFDQGSPQLP